MLLGITTDGTGTQGNTRAPTYQGSRNSTSDWMALVLSIGQVENLGARKLPKYRPRQPSQGAIKVSLVRRGECKGPLDTPSSPRGAPFQFNHRAQ